MRAREMDAVEIFNFKKEETETEKQQASEQEKEKQKRIAGTRRTPRDVQIVCALALARYLSTDQLRRLFFKDCIPKIAVRRLRMLSGGVATKFSSPLLRRVRGRADDGAPIPVWALTERGYELAAERLGVPRRPVDRDISEQFMRHTLQLNELLVRLLLRHLQIDGSGQFRRMPLHWLSAECQRLSFFPESANPRSRHALFIQPDAVLELPKERRRILVEYETGTHPLESRSPSRQGATARKIERYISYLYTRYSHGEQPKSRYFSQFPDRFAPELLFVCRSAHRAESIGNLIRRKGRQTFVMRAETIDQVARELEARIASVDLAAAAERPTVQLEGEAREMILTFYLEALTSLKQARDTIRAANMKPGMNLRVPEYPSNANSVRAAIGR